MPNNWREDIGVPAELDPQTADNVRLALRRVKLHKGNTSEEGVQFVWLKPNGKQSPYRGQTIIHHKQQIVDLLERAEKAGLFKDLNETKT